MTEAQAPAGEETLTVAFEPTEEEYFDVGRSILRIASPLASRAWLVGVFVVGLIAAILAALGGGDGLWTRIVPPLALSWILFVALLAGAQRAALRRHQREAFAHGRAVTMELSPWGCRCRWPGGEQATPWHAMMHAVEDGNLFLLFYMTHCAYFVPRRVLSVAEEARLRRLLKAWMGERSRIADA